MRSASTFGRLALTLAALCMPARSLIAQERVVVRVEPGTPLVANEVVVAVGPADETPDQAGIAYLAARSIAAPIASVIDSLGARLVVRATKEGMSFSLVAAPDAWPEASRTLLVALFRDPADSVSVERQRRAIAAELTAREASPADELARETDAAVFGSEHPWKRPAVGYAGTVRKVTPTEVDGFMRQFFTPERSLAVVVGPVEADSVLRHLKPYFAATAPAPVVVEAGTSADATVRKEYNSITAWISASYRFAADADVDALRMLSALVTEQISFGPSRRSVYNARGEVVPHAGGGEIRFQLVVPPAEVNLWTARLTEAVAAYGAEPLGGGIFADRFRRFRGERLLELESPEARAQAIARAVLLTGRATDPAGGSLALTAGRLQEAARSLSAPVVVILEPELTDAS